MASLYNDSGELNLFGFTVTKNKNKDSEAKSFVSQQDINGGTEVNQAAGAGFNSYSIDLDPSSIKTEVDLIAKYREISLVSDIDLAISEIIDEFLIVDEINPLLEIDFTEEFATKYSDKTKKTIVEEFKNILKLLKFNQIGPDIARNFYIDGRTAYHKVVDPEKPKDGIIELRPIDAARLKRIIEVQKEIDPKTGISLVKGQTDYYVYSADNRQTGTYTDTKTGIKITPESIAYVTSGLIDRNTNLSLSYLHKAIRPLNQLRMMEDSEVIHRMTRAPSRRVFYINTSGMARTKAEQYIKDIMARYKNKQVYNVQTGTVSDAKAHTSMLEDYFLPRSSDGKGTEITTLDSQGCLAMDTKVKLLDGRDLSILEIKNEMDSGKVLWTYSCHPSTGAIVPGVITWAGITQKSAKVMKLTFDNGEELVCTPDHKFPIYGKGFVEAKDLGLNESMIPIYTKNDKISDFKKLEYTKVFDNETKKWNFVHRVVAESLKDIIVNDFVYDDLYTNDIKNTVHHKNRNRFDNDPANLCFMPWYDHTEMHHKLGFTIEDSKKGAAAASERLRNMKEFEPEKYKKWCNDLSVKQKEYIANLDQEARSIRDARSIENFKLGTAVFLEKLKDPEYYSTLCSNRKELWNNNEARKLAASERAKINNKIMWDSAEHRENYKIKQKAEINDIILKAIIDLIKDKTSHQFTAEMVTDALNSNSQLVSEFVELNKNKTSKFNKTEFTKGVIKKGVEKFGYANWIDFRKKCSIHNHRLVKIEYLDEPIEVGTLTIDENELIHNYHTFALTCGVFTKNSLASIDNTTYFQQKLFQALNIPLSRLQQGQGTFNIGRSNEITRDEIKFSKFISKLRLRFNGLFVDLLKTQLLLKGITTEEDWEVIKESLLFKYGKDNFFAELKESDILRERLQTVAQADIYVGKYFSKRYVMREILKMSDKECDDMDEQNAEEAAQDNPDPNAGQNVSPQNSTQ